MAHNILHIFNQLKPISLPGSYGEKAYQLSMPHQLAAAFMLNILSLALPVMMLQIYDRIIPHESYGTLIMLIVGISIALVLDVALRIIRAYLITWSAASHEHAASTAAIDIFSNSNIAAFENKSAGEHMQNLASFGKLREFYSGQTWTAMIDLPFAAIFLALIAYLGGVLVLVPLILLAIFIFNASVAGNSLRNALLKRSESDDGKASFAVSVLNGIHTVKSMSLEFFLMRKFEDEQKDVSRDSYNVALTSGMASILGATFGQLSLIMTATIGSLLVLNGDLSVGGLSACTLLAGRCIQPVQRVLGTWLRLQDLDVAKTQAQTVFSTPVLRRIKKIIPAPQGRVVIDNISYGQSSETGFTLNNISLSLKPGDIIAVTGADRTAKSALLQIISGVLSPKSGSVFLDDINVHEHGLAELSSFIGYMPKQGTIFKGTIIENMAGFRDDEASIRKAKQAGQDLGLEQIIDHLPKGYQTMLFDSAADPVTLVPVALVICYAVLIFAIGPKIRNHARLAAANSTKRQEFLLETVTKLRAIRLAGLESVWLERYRALSGQTSLSNSKSAFSAQILETLSYALMKLGGVATLSFGVTMVIEKTMTVGALIASMMLIWRIIAPLQICCASLTRIQQLSSSVKQVERLLSVPPENNIHDQALTSSEMKGAISFHRVSIKYSQENEPALLGISFDIKPGQIISIKGNNGSGKSTILKLILGLYQPQAGSIRIDGVDIRQFNPLYLRQNIAYVPQHADFFPGSIRDNLFYSNPAATEDDMVEALADACAMDEILSLSEGLDTFINIDSQETISFALRQKLNLARAYIRKSSIYLFDEPSYSLGLKSDHAFEKKIKQLRGMATIILATHREDHMRLADQLFIMNKGEMTHAGPPEPVLNAIKGKKQ